VAVCPGCDTTNPDGFRFCGQCGLALTVVSCPSCGVPNAAGQLFCGQCGLSLEGSPARLSGPPPDERKLATVLFADVVGFTSLAERTDPEIVARMVDAAFRELGEVVAAHGGTVDKFMGDSVMAVFGVPVAHDDDAERAVAAALAMRDLGGELAFSIGVYSGEVMATAVGRAGDATVIGDTVNVAARLEKAAGPGEVLCGRLTVDLVRGRVRFRERQPVLLKGKRDPVEVFVAEALQRDDSDWAATGPPLVGRDDELAFLIAQWRRVIRERQAHVVLLSGDAGSGKTRLVNELAGAVGGEAVIVRANYPAYGVMGGARVAEEIIGQLGPATDEGVNARVRSVAGRIDPSLKSIDPEGLAQEQLWGFARLLQEKSGGRPLLLMIDDMHRSDDRTLELIAEVASRLPNVPVLMLLAGRVEPGDWLVRFPSATNVRLAPLSRFDAAALASAFVPDKPLTMEAAEFLAERASGNPLYLRELVAMAHARGLFVEAGDRYQLSAYEAIPATLQALLAARLDALEPGQKLCLQHVAVLGEAATADQVSNLGAPQAVTALRSLVDSGLLRLRTDGRYDTADPLLREVAYETLPRNARGELHRQAAKTAVQLQERARHLDRAAEYLAGDEDLGAEAAEALAAEGMQLVESSRQRDALRVLERAVALGCRRTPVLFGLAKAQALCGDEPGAQATLALVEDDPCDPAVAVERDHIAANAKVFSDPSSAAPRLDVVANEWHELDDKAREAWARANTGVAYFNMSRMDEAAVALERGLGLFEEVGDRAGALSTSSFLCIVKPTDHRVAGWLADALEFADAAGDRAKQLNTLTTLTWNHFFRSFCGGPADVAATEGFAHRLAALAEELGANDPAIHSWSLLVVMARLSGRLELAAERAAQLQRVARSVREGDVWLAWAAGFSSAVIRGATGATPPFPPATAVDPVTAMAVIVIEAELIMAGRLDEAIAHLGRPRRPELGVISDLAGIFRGLALLLAGRAEEARPFVDRAAAAAHVLEAFPAAIAAAALQAEIRREGAEALPRPAAEPRSLSELLVLRARATQGDADALRKLHEAVAGFAAPGLAIGL